MDLFVFRPKNKSQKPDTAAHEKSKFSAKIIGDSSTNCGVFFFFYYEKETESLPLFKSKLKLKLLSFSNEIALLNYSHLLVQ